MSPQLMHFLARKSNLELEYISQFPEEFTAEEVYAADEEIELRLANSPLSARAKIAKRETLKRTIRKSFGFPTKAFTEYSIEEYTAAEYITIAKHALDELDWEIEYISPSGILARTQQRRNGWGEEVSILIKNGKAQVISKCTGRGFLDFGYNNRNIEKYLNAFYKTSDHLTVAELHRVKTILYQELALEKNDKLYYKYEPIRSSMGDIFSILLPRNGYIITPVLIGINVLIFFLMAFSGVNILFPDTADLVNWGANYKPSTLDGEGFRLLTNTFLHIGIIHLAVNMYTLLFIGIILEPILGKARFLSAYILAGIAGSLASLWWHDWSVAAGASGAIFGMFGLSMSLLLTNYIGKAARNNLLLGISVFILYNLTSLFDPTVDNAAHIGGMIAGFLIGFIYYFSLTQPKNIVIKYGSMAVAGCFFIGISVLGYYTIPNNGVITYNEIIKQYETNEQKALLFYDIKDFDSKYYALDKLKKGKKLWNKNLELLERLDNLELPPHFQYRKELMQEYCRSRIEGYDLLYRSIAEETDVYDEELEEIDYEIEYLLSEIDALNL